MITLLSFLISVSLLMLFGPQWAANILSTHNLAEIGAAVFGIIALSASVQIRGLFEKAQNILRMYAQYTNPNSEEGRKLSPQEKVRLLDLFLNELRIVLDQFGGKLIIRVGGFIRKASTKLFG